MSEGAVSDAELDRRSAAAIDHAGPSTRNGLAPVGVLVQVN
jgi:hypothetical protein